MREKGVRKLGSARVAKVVSAKCSRVKKLVPSLARESSAQIFT